MGLPLQGREISRQSNLLSGVGNNHDLMISSSHKMISHNLRIFLLPLSNHCTTNRSLIVDQLLINIYYSHTMYTGVVSCINYMVFVSFLPQASNADGNMMALFLMSCFLIKIQNLNVILSTILIVQSSL